MISDARREADLANLARLDAAARNVVAEHLPAGEPASLLNFPNHRNAGDSALWLAARSVVEDRAGPVTYTCSANGFDARRFERSEREGTIVLNAGGNFGDLYPEGQQRLRELVLSRYRGRRVLQLPQSIHFQDPANLERMRRLVGEHGNVTILCRDAASLVLAEEAFDAQVAYCPDLAVCLGPLPEGLAGRRGTLSGSARLARPLPPARVDVLWLARQDPEKVHAPPEASPDVEVVDWLYQLPDEPAWPPSARFAFAANQRLLGGGSAPRLRQRSIVAAASSSTFEPLARGWVRRGLEILARGRVVVTDRLHAHLLAHMAGMPTVVLDNSYGKVHGVVALTTAGSPSTHLAGSSAEALEIARDVVRSQGGR